MFSCCRGWFPRQPDATVTYVHCQLLIEKIGGIFINVFGLGQTGQATLDANKDVEIKPVVEKENVETVKDNKREEVDPKVKQGVNKLNKFLQDENAKAVIERHKVFGDIMIKIINSKTKEVLLEIPPEKLLDMIAKMCEIAGLKLDKKV